MKGLSKLMIPCIFNKGCNYCFLKEVGLLKLVLVCTKVGGGVGFYTILVELLMRKGLSKLWINRQAQVDVL